MTDFQRERETLGLWLQQLRKEKGLNGKQLAERLGWQPSKVSRIENGRQTPSTSDVTEWAQALGIPEVVQELAVRLAALESHYVSWKRSLRDGHAPRQRMSISLESRSRSIRNFETGIVPGLLQTAEYARNVFSRLVELRGTPNDVTEAVQVRMQRQHILYDPAKRLHFIVTTGALRARLCPVSVLRGQIDRLMVATTMENVAFGVLAEETDLPLPANHPFWVFDQSLVMVETFAAELNLEDPHEIELYCGIFDRFSAIASYGESARRILTQLAAELADPTPDSQEPTSRRQ